MSTPKTNKDMKKKPTYSKSTVGDVEKATGVSIGVPPETKLTKYFEDKGLPNLAKMIDLTDAELAK